MKTTSRRARRHRNPHAQEEAQQKPFFSKASDAPIQTKPDSAFFQPKLEVSPANDPAEKEADDIANQVVQQTQQNASVGVQRKKQIHRQTEKEEPKAKLEVQRQGKEEEMQKKVEVQRQTEKEEPKAKLEVQRQGKEEEMQKKVEVQRQTEKEEPKAKLEVQRQGKEEEMQKKVEVQRQTEKEEPKAKLLVNRKEDANEKNSKESNQASKDAAPGGTNLEMMLEKTRGKGFELPEDVRSEMEAQFEYDFSKVRIHTDEDAIKMCQRLNAQAFTHGYDIYFNEGKYNPDTETGKNLLAHELTHVVQQKG